MAHLDIEAHGGPSQFSRQQNLRPRLLICLQTALRIWRHIGRKF
uniref:Uncharacterized protein n=1 Tax=Rhizophora mucronata TaxID=61149 RepID=A0A2P2QQH7_RHIMU